MTVTKKQVANFRRKIKNAQSSFGAMGEMILRMDIDALSLDQRRDLRGALASSRAPLFYPYLDKKCINLNQESI